MEKIEGDLQPTPADRGDPRALAVALEGDVLLATVRTVDEDSARLDLNRPEGEIECILPLADLALAEPGDELRAGDQLEVFVERSKENAAELVASKSKADSLRLWDEISRAEEEGVEVEGEVIAKIRGGLAVDIGVKAFLPASQATSRQGADPDNLIGQRLTFNVIEFNKKRGNIVLSRRKQLEAEQAALKQSTLGRLVEGEVLTGRVRSFTEYGAFVDLGGIDGLAHVTDLSWGRIKHPSEALTIGDEIKVKVLKFDAERERVSLGYKQLQTDPWAAVEEKYPEGHRIEGPVVSLMDYGVFVELEPGVDGLVHATEMSWVRRVKHPSELVSVGQRVQAVVLDVDSGQRRIALGMKQTQENPWEAFAEAHPEGSVVSCVVRRIKEFGVFVETPEGLDGLVRMADLSWSQRINKPRDLFEVGDEVQAMVLEIEPAKERLGLGIKQLTEDPWAGLEKKYPPGSKLTGTVTKAVDFGLFVEIEPGIEGLCHISQLSNDRVDKPTDVAQVGASLEVAVVEIDRDKRRISLSVRALVEDTGDYRKYQIEQAEEEKRFGNALGVALAEKLAADEAEHAGDDAGE